MPAYAHQTRRKHLIVIFGRFGEETTRMHVNDGMQALLQAVSLLIQAGPLQEGDILSIQHGDEGPELPEVSRASHSSS